MFSDSKESACYEINSAKAAEIKLYVKNKLNALYGKAYSRTVSNSKVPCDEHCIYDDTDSAHSDNQFKDDLPDWKSYKYDLLTISYERSNRLHVVEVDLPYMDTFFKKLRFMWYFWKTIQGTIE